MGRQAIEGDHTGAPILTDNVVSLYQYFLNASRCGKSLRFAKQ